MLRKFSANAYELEIPTRVGISPIFNVAYLYPYVAVDIGTFAEGEDPTEDLQWVAQPLEFEAILDTKVVKSTRKKDYMEYLVKWKKRPTEDSTWSQGFHCSRSNEHGFINFHPCKYDVGAS